LQLSIPASRSVFDLSALKQEIQDLEQKTLEPGFWDDRNQAEKLSRDLGFKTNQIEKFQNWESKLADIDELQSMLQEAASEEKTELELMYRTEFETLQTEFNAFEFERMLSGPYDIADAMVSINAGAGGTDAQDWAEILLRMYTRWAENIKGFKFELLEKSMGEEAGIKSATFKISGAYAYGYLSAEKGVHRLVRKSPFKSSGDSRQTSFAGVEVYPVIDKSQSGVEIKDTDLDIETMRSGGAGGQNVNKLETAVRIKHIPSGIVVKCSQERTQVRNKERALEIVMSRLLAQKEEEERKKIAELRGEVVSASWGNAIRSYVFDEERVKDARTKHETRDVQRVIDGDIDDFIEAYLKMESSQN